MSFIWIKKSIGLNILPCGTPHVISISLDKGDIFTTLYLFVKYKINHLFNIALAP